MKNKKLAAILLSLVIAITTIAFPLAGSADPISPSSTSGEWERTAATSFDALFPDIGGEITSMEYYDGDLWAFGTSSYSTPVFARFDGTQWVDVTPPDGLNNAWTVSESAVIDGSLVVATSSSSADSAQLWIYKPETGWLFDNHLPAVHYIFGIAVSGTDICLATNTTTLGETVYCDLGGGWVEFPLDGFADPSFSYAKSPITFANGTPILAVSDYNETHSSGLYALIEGDWELIPNTNLNGSGIDWVAVAGYDNSDMMLVAKEDAGTGTVDAYVMNTQSGLNSRMGSSNFGADGTFENVTALKIVGAGAAISVMHDGVGEVWSIPYADNSGDDWSLLNDEQDFSNFDNSPANQINDFIFPSSKPFVATSYTGEGSYYPSVWNLKSVDPEVPTTTTTTPGDTDADHDGVNSAIEQGAPNAGDGNGDGQQDADQSNVASFPNAVDGKYVTLVSPVGTTLSGVSNAPESKMNRQDRAFDFKFGLTTFTVSGVTPNATIEMKIYFDSTDAANSFVARKLVGSSYSTLSGSSILNVIVGANTPAVKLTYGIKDNGPLDTNATLGVITDPVGLGSAPSVLPSTGTNATLPLVRFAGLTLMAGAVLVVMARRRRFTFI